MKHLITSYLLASVIFLIIDVIWLSVTVKIFYKPQIGQLLNDKPIIWAAVLFYLIYTVGLTLIIIKPAISNYDFFQAFWTGILFGIVAYGTYNLTNMATLNGWSINVVIVDMIWGGVLTAVSAKLTIYLTQKLLAL